MNTKLQTLFYYSHRRNAAKIATVYSLETAIAITNIIFPLFIFSMMDDIRTNKVSISQLTATTSLFMLNTFLPRVRDIVVAYIRYGVQTDVTVDMVASVYNRELDNLLGAPTGSCAVITSKNYGTVGDLVPAFFSGILPVVFETAATSAFLSLRYGSVGLAPLLTLVAYLSMAVYGETTSVSYKEQSSKFKISGFGALLSSINNYQLAHQFGNTGPELSKLRDELSKLEVSHKSEQYATEKNALVLSIISKLGFALAIMFAFNKGYDSSKPIFSEDFILLSYFLIKLCLSIESLPTKINTFCTGLVDADLVVNFLNEKSNIPEPKFPIDFKIDAPPRVEFKNVCFTYPSKGNVTSEGLYNINLKIKPKQKLVIMGATGSGKSTLLKLIQRFYNFQGEILIDGIDIKSISKKDLRQSLSVVSQETGLIDDTVYNNISYADMSARERDVLKAAQFAGLTLQRERFFTKIQQQGTNFSGGEKQRVSIARSLLKPNAYVFLLDEPTSSLDQETSKYVLNVLDQLSKHGTAIIVTHDPNVAVNADHIIYLNKGRIVEEGTYSELMGKRGEFHKQVVVQCEKLGISVGAIKPLEKSEHSVETDNFGSWRMSRNFSQ